MKNIKKYLLALLIVVLILVPTLSIADFGDFESYDSGSDWGGSSDWDFGGSSDWGDSPDLDYGGYAGSYGLGYISGRGGTAIVIFIIILFIIITVLKNANSNYAPPVAPTGNTYRPSGYISDKNRSAMVANNVIKVDPQFNADTFISSAKDLFIRLQNSWMKRNIEELRPLLSEAMFEQYSNSIQNYIDRKQINKLERICTNFAELVSFSQDNEKDTLVVAVNSSMIDYIIDENTGKVLKGDTEIRRTNTYKMTFVRKKGVLTEEGTDKLKTTNCPNCGAPTHITSSGKCEYCNSIITTGSHDWILIGMEKY